MKLAEIRTKFLDYFKENGHTVVKSSPLVPANDPTLLFTNAGMVQFKDVFLGTDERSYSKAVSVQRCLRAGGKHNDLENVGYTARHHTFFEMLGNFSFGDYFKKEAISLAWNFLTKEIKLPPERLWVTVYEEDDEAADIWLNHMKVDPNRFSRCGKKDNFWAMGDTGPCGPCTEIFYDHGPEIPGGPPGSPDGDLDRYIEIWNLVFMQFERDTNGKLTPLPKQSVDTGMGIERLAAVVQGVHNNYEVDLFVNLIKSASELTGCKDLANQSLRVIADHIRACSFLIADGVMPSNEGRGYVLRRIIRRAARHGNKLGVSEPFFYKLAESLCIEMGQAYPELLSAKEIIKKILHQEEQQFARTLDQGLKRIDSVLAILNNSTDKTNQLDGKFAFELYDTYGFPIDLILDIARERNFIVDIEAFEENLKEQRERSKQSSSFKNNNTKKTLNITEVTDFVGYEQLSAEITVTAILNNEQDNLDSLSGHENTGYIVSASTPFYAEGGGQVGDTGILKALDNSFTARVINTVKINKAHLHQIIIQSGKVKTGDKLWAEVDSTKRLATARNHTATHFLHAALRKILGTQVIQKGSYVGPDYLRFDFAYYQAVSKSDLDIIEQEVNTEILKNTKASVDLMQIEQALDSGAMALFGEKYDEKVRVLNFGNGYSVELCGGTHAHMSGDIGIFVITSEGGVASGIRRIEAITGDTARMYLKERENTLREAVELLKTTPDNLLEKIKQLQQECNLLSKELSGHQQSQAKQQGKNLLDKAIDINGIKVLITRIDNSVSNINSKNLRETLDQLKSELQKAVIILAVTEIESEANAKSYKVTLISGVTNNCTDRLHAGKLINIVAGQLGGKGGGRPDMAQAGGRCSELREVDTALASVLPTVKQLLDN